MDKNVSIIVPVYNVENRLKKCVDSLLSQTYKNIIIFLVDDGSTDNSGQICDKYATDFSNIKVIHKSNGGQGEARNYALDIIKDGLVCFVDSDDYVTNTYVENLYTAMKSQHADMSMSWFKEIWDNDTQKYTSSTKIKQIKIYNNVQCLEKLFYQDGVDSAVWGKLIPIELFDNLRFPVGVKYEDIPVVYRLIDRCKNIAVIDNPDYYYWQRTNGMSTQNSKFNESKLTEIQFMEDMNKYIENHHPELIRAAQCRLFSATCNLYFQIPKSSPYKHKSWQLIQSLRKDVLLNHKARKKARIGALLSYCGSGFMTTVYKNSQKRGKNLSNN